VIKSSVSVILPAYQSAETIARSLKSLVNQTIAPSEVIVVDDGSDDGTIEAAEAMRKELSDTDLKIIRQDHRGAGAARNRALREASSNYVAFLDSDDEWLPEKLERSIEVLEATGSVLVSHDYVRCEPNGSKRVVLDCSNNFNRRGDPFVRLYRLGYIATSGVVAQRDAVLSAGGFDESLPVAQDFALWLSMLKKPDTPFKIFSGALLLYHVTSGSITTQTEKRLECTLKIARRYYDTIAVRSGWPIFSLWYRVVAVHYEAMVAYTTQKRYFFCLMVLLRIPINLVKLTFFTFLSKNTLDETSPEN